MPKALRNFREAPRSFREVFWGNADAVAGYRGDLGCDFLARGGIPGCDFLPAEVFRTALCAMGAPFSGTCGIRCRQCWHLQNSVPERASYGTEGTQMPGKRALPQTALPEIQQTPKRGLFPRQHYRKSNKHKKEVSSPYSTTGKSTAAAIPWQQGIVYSGGGAPTHRFNYFLTLFL